MLFPATWCWATANGRPPGCGAGASRGVQARKSCGPRARAGVWSCPWPCRRRLGCRERRSPLPGCRRAGVTRPPPRPLSRRDRGSAGPRVFEVTPGGGGTTLLPGRGPVPESRPPGLSPWRTGVSARRWEEGTAGPFTPLAGLWDGPRTGPSAEAGRAGSSTTPGGAEAGAGPAELHVQRWMSGGPTRRSAGSRRGRAGDPEVPTRHRGRWLVSLGFQGRSWNGGVKNTHHDDGSHGPPARAWPG